MPTTIADASSVNANHHFVETQRSQSLFYYHAQLKHKKQLKLESDENNNDMIEAALVRDNNGISDHDNHNDNENSPLRVLIFTESFHPYTSGIARRFKEILKRLSESRLFLIHVVTGCKVIYNVVELFLKQSPIFSSFVMNNFLCSLLGDNLQGLFCPYICYELARTRI